MFIFAALRKEVQLVVCAVRTQSELSGSPALLVSARLYTQTVFTQTILRQQLLCLWSLIMLRYGANL